MVTENIISPASLNSFVDEDEDRELGDLVLDDTGPNPEHHLIDEKIIADFATFAKGPTSDIAEFYNIFDYEIRKVYKIYCPDANGTENIYVICYNGRQFDL